jgi:hypothetical protein
MGTQVECLYCGKAYSVIDKKVAPDAVVYFRRHEKAGHPSVVHCCTVEHLILWLAENVATLPIVGEGQSGTGNLPLVASGANLRAFVAAVKRLIDRVDTLEPTDGPALLVRTSEWKYVEQLLPEFEEAVRLLEILEKANTDDAELASRRAALGQTHTYRYREERQANGTILKTPELVSRPLINAEDIEVLIQEGTVTYDDKRVKNRQKPSPLPDAGDSKLLVNFDGRD